MIPTKTFASNVKNLTTPILITQIAEKRSNLQESAPLLTLLQNFLNLQEQNYFADPVGWKAMFLEIVQKAQ